MQRQPNHLEAEALHGLETDQRLSHSSFPHRVTHQTNETKSAG
jgi:hypothetical protein